MICRVTDYYASITMLTQRIRQTLLIRNLNNKPLDLFYISPSFLLLG